MPDDVEQFSLDDFFREVSQREEIAEVFEEDVNRFTCSESVSFDQRLGREIHEIRDRPSCYECLPETDDYLGNLVKLVHVVEVRK